MKCGARLDGAESNTDSDAKTKKSAARIVIPIVIVAVVIVAIVVGVVLTRSHNGAQNVPDFQALFDEYCSSIWADTGSDNSYLKIDSNPFDEDLRVYSQTLRTPRFRESMKSWVFRITCGKKCKPRIACRVGRAKHLVISV